MNLNNPWPGRLLNFQIWNLLDLSDQPCKKDFTGTETSMFFFKKCWQVGVFISEDEMEIITYFQNIYHKKLMINQALRAMSYSQKMSKSFNTKWPALTLFTEDRNMHTVFKNSM